MNRSCDFVVGPYINSCEKRLKMNDETAFKRNDTENPEGLNQEKITKSNAIEIPFIALPKGGGALRGIDEKFEVNTANGTAGLSIPLPVTPGRNGVAPSFGLQYNTGGGNGSFGLGWSLSLPSIQRQTDKGIPRYLEGNDADVYLFSDEEDLVPALSHDLTSQEWVPEITTVDGIVVQAFRPRIEGRFSRIEKIAHPDLGTYWKVTTRENTVTFFGKSAACRMADPKNASRIFQWLPELTYDDKGNVIQYHYKHDSNIMDNGSTQVDATMPAESQESNRRAGIAPYTQTYLKKVTYGYHQAYYPDDANPYIPRPLSDGGYFFELVFDYGEHDLQIPTPAAVNNWIYRQDAFSSYRSGFEIRTSRLCRRVLMFHHFPGERQFIGTTDEGDFGMNYLVSSLDFGYAPSSINDSGQAEVTYLVRATRYDYIRKRDGSYSQKGLPSLEFSYQHLQWNKTIKTVSEESLIHSPTGITPNYQWVDLYGEGISGILSEQGEGWYYKRNLGNVLGEDSVTFNPATQVFPRSSFSGLSNGTLSLQDLAGNGQRQLVFNHGEVSGYFEFGDGEQVEAFREFEHRVNINLQDPNVRLVDLTGDGKPDLVVTEDNVFTWYASEGKSGYRRHERTLKAVDEEEGPAIVFADEKQTIFLADMSGDGLTDLVRIRNGEICYWANMGYGKFSAKITMANAPRFDYPDLFNPLHLHLADVSGTGATDILYLGENKFKAYINLSGNGWSDAHEIDPFFPIDDQCQLSVVDLLGTGTSCIVWSSHLPGHSLAPMRFIDLLDSRKPHIMVGYKNNLGREVSLEHKSSTYYYLKDKLEGKPWITKVPFPVRVLSKHTVAEEITQVKFSKEYRYHHGYYDHAEKEFRGFGMVEQIDTEVYSEWKKLNDGNQLEKDESFYQPPLLTRTWFHTGGYLDREQILTQFEHEYWINAYNQAFPLAHLDVSEPTLQEAQLSAEMSRLAGDEYREALRACKGMVLREEVFSLDGKMEDPESLKKQAKPYTVSTRNCLIQQVQPRHHNLFAVFMVTECESLNIHYERDEFDPRIAHTLHTVIDEIGQAIETASVVYPRKQRDNSLPPDVQAKQAHLYLTYVQNFYTNDVKTTANYRLRGMAGSNAFEITGLFPSQELFQHSDFENVLTTGSREIQYHQNQTVGQIERRMIESVRTLYNQDSLQAPLSWGVIESKGIRYESYQLAFTGPLLQDVYGDKLPTGPPELGNLLGNNDADGISSQGKFVHFNDDHWWIRSGTVQYLNSGESLEDVQRRFYFPRSFTDAFGTVTTVSYWKDYYVFLESTTDALGSQVVVERINFRSLSPCRMRDINDNVSEVLLDERRLVKAYAVMGKGNEADDLVGLTETTTEEEEEFIKTYFTLSDTALIRDRASQLLQHATTRFVYDFDRYRTSALMLEEQLENEPAVLPCAAVKLLPVAVGGISREQHYAANQNSAIQLNFVYSDGNGHVVMTKAQARPGEALVMTVDPDCRYTVQTVDTAETNQLRWLGHGRTIRNNKNNPIKQYEPYFSVAPFFDEAKALVERGVTPLFYYDPIGRVIRTELPDGTFTKTEFSAWQQTIYDAADTVLESPWFVAQGSPDPNGAPPVASAALAAWKSAQHASTPSILHLDTLGRTILKIDHNRIDGVDELYTTTVHLDIEGNALGIVDHRGNTVTGYKYNLLGHRVYQKSMDAGERWVLNNAAGNPLRSWDSRSHIFSTVYDRLQRPIETRVQGGEGSALLDYVIAKVIYGEGSSDDKLNNLRGRVVERFDTSGRIINIRFDFKGNLLRYAKQLISDYKQTPNWPVSNGDDLLESEVFIFSSNFDALNRVVTKTTPDESVTTPIYDEAGSLRQVSVQLAAIDGTPEQVTSFVQNIRYNEKGQRISIRYGNNVQTDYTYHPDNFRLARLVSRKQSNDLLQDLIYTYDAVGNVTEVVDHACPEVFFGNHQVEPKSEYTYDALYRLVQASGREHIAQVDPGREDNWNDLPFLKRYNVNDPMAWRTYMQSYQYDGVGNITQLRHQANGGSWTRDFDYELDNNRLIRTRVGNETYVYPHHAAHGFITQMPQLSLIRWNFKDQLQATARQVVNNGTPETTYYVYDGAGQRVRKVTENEGGATIKDERIYLEGVEFYRKHNGRQAGLERVTLHISDDLTRIAMVDTRNEVNDDTDRRTIRYQLTNHLGSATLELTGDPDPGVINYEEYHPYGTTAYQAVNADVRAAAKRYRYTGMERDEETGMSYHSARYYLPWLGRWLSADPIGTGGGLNLYGYAYNNPIFYIDTTGNEPGGGLFLYKPPVRPSEPPPEPAPPPPPKEPTVIDEIREDPDVQFVGGVANGVAESFIPFPMSLVWEPPTPEYAEGHMVGSMIGVKRNLKNMARAGGGGYGPGSSGAASVAMTKLEIEVMIGALKVVNALAAVVVDAEVVASPAGGPPVAVPVPETPPPAPPEPAAPATPETVTLKPKGPPPVTPTADMAPLGPEYYRAAEARSAQLKRDFGKTEFGKITRERYNAEKKLRNEIMKFNDYLYPKGPNDVNIGGLRGSRALDEIAANQVAGYTKTPEGYSWHHHEDLGRMQLVERRVHAGDGLYHEGGVSIWRKIMGIEYQ
jgi:RHS repeat-associated protein